MILLEGTDLKGAETLAEKIRQKIASTNVAASDNPIYVTMSLGVDAQQSKANLFATLGSADKAMYGAKRKGRNCVVVAG